MSTMTDVNSVVDVGVLYARVDCRNADGGYMNSVSTTSLGLVNLAKTGRTAGGVGPHTPWAV